MIYQHKDGHSPASITIQRVNLSWERGLLAVKRILANGVQGKLAAFENAISVHFFHK
jgi:hypothetical protein